MSPSLSPYCSEAMPLLHPRRNRRQEHCLDPYDGAVFIFLGYECRGPARHQSSRVLTRLMFSRIDPGRPIRDRDQARQQERHALNGAAYRLPASF